MIIECVWEHNGNDSLIYATTLPGAYARGESRDIAMGKLDRECRAYMRWAGMEQSDELSFTIVQDVPSGLEIRDADSDVLFDGEKAPLTAEEYVRLKSLVLKSAADFQMIYDAFPDKRRASAPPRKTFYGALPRTAEEMYLHTKSVNAYYFGEIGIDADNEGGILGCRQRGFAALESQPDYLENRVFSGSYGEDWCLRKLLRRFIWHDRIHARAMLRLARREFGVGVVPDPFGFF